MAPTTRRRKVARVDATAPGIRTGDDDENEHDGDELDFIGRVRRDLARIRFILSLRVDYVEHDSDLSVNHRQIIEAVEDLLTHMHAKVTKALGHFESDRWSVA